MSGAERYRIERHPGGWFRRWRVMVGTRSVPVFIGTERQCLKVQRALICAYNDGHWVAEQTFVDIRKLTDPEAK